MLVIFLLFLLWKKEEEEEEEEEKEKTSNGITIRFILKHFMNLSYPCFAISP